MNVRYRPKALSLVLTVFLGHRTGALKLSTLGKPAMYSACEYSRSEHTRRGYACLHLFHCCICTTVFVIPILIRSLTTRLPPLNTISSRICFAYSTLAKRSLDSLDSEIPTSLLHVFSLETGYCKENCISYFYETSVSEILRRPSIVSILFVRIPNPFFRVAASFFRANSFLIR